MASSAAFAPLNQHLHIAQHSTLLKGSSLPIPTPVCMSTQPIIQLVPVAPFFIFPALLHTFLHQTELAPPSLPPFLSHSQKKSCLPTSADHFLLAHQRQILSPTGNHLQRRPQSVPDCEIDHEARRVVAGQWAVLARVPLFWGLLDVYFCCWCQYVMELTHGKYS